MYLTINSLKKRSNYFENYAMYRIIIFIVIIEQNKKINFICIENYSFG